MPWLTSCAGTLLIDPAPMVTTTSPSRTMLMIATALIIAFGFAFMFGEGNGWIGHQFFFLNAAPETYGTTGVSFLAFFLFQFAFADTASTIVSGAMVGRTDFKGDLLYSIGVSGFIYPIVGHWIWGPGGWLGTMDTPFRDFAGSTVVHTVGGMLALTGAIALVLGREGLFGLRGSRKR